MSQRVARGENMLAKVGDKLGMTEEGRQWLIGCVDPFHDAPLDICGFPDGSIDPVVTQIVRQSVNVTCPSSITTGTWDVQIISLPFSKNVRLGNSANMAGTNTNPDNQIYINNTPATITAGGLSYTIVPTGTSFNPSTTIPTAFVPNPIPDQYLLGNTRVIGKGFEVHNTTSVLNRQGMCTTWTIPIDDIQNSAVVSTGFVVAGVGNTVTTVNALQIPMWPQSQAAAVLIPGSRQWTAEQGCYIVPKLRTNNVPITDTGFFVQPFVNGGDSSNPSLNMFSLSTNTGITNFPPAFQSVFWDNFDMHGAIFSGLSLQTTLTINYVWLVERHPDVTISDLVVLARPPPERDNVALELYTHISRKLPTGVPVGENGLGDWFMDALSTAADFISPVLSAVPGVGGALSGGVNALNSLYKQHKVSYQNNPYSAVTANEVKGVYNAAASVVGQLRGNRSKKSIKQEVKAEVKKDLGMKKKKNRIPKAPALMAAEAAAFRRVAGRNALGGRA